MTPEQALEILNQATKNIQATREQHQIMLSALETLKKVLEQK